MKINKERLIKPAMAVAAVVTGLVVTFAVSHSGSEKEVSGVVDNTLEIAQEENETAEISTALIGSGLHSLVGAQESFFEGSIVGEIYFDDAEGNSTEETPAEEPTTEEPTTEESEPEMFVAKVKEYMNVRKGPSTDTDIVGKLYVGSGGIVIEKGEEWSLIESGNVTGYVCNKYVLFGEEAEEYAWDVGEITAVATVNCLRLREGNGTNTKVVSVINKGTKVEVKEKGDEGWSEVIYGKYAGYCSNDYLEFSVSLDNAMTLEEEKAWKAELAAKKAAEEAEAARKAAEEKAALEKAIANSKFVETVKTSPYDVTEEDAYLLACLVYAEAGVECYEGKLAVANIVLNRLNGGYYGDTISDVIYAKNQFSVVNSGALSRAIRKGPNADSIKAAKEALSGVNNVPNYSGFCMKYVAKYSKYAEYSIIGNQVFYRRK